MAEPHPSLVEDDVENTSDSSYDEDESEESDENSSSDEGSSSSGTSNSSVEEDEEDDSSESEAGDIWGSSGEEVETEEAAEAGLHADYFKALEVQAEGKFKEALFLMRSLLEHPLLKCFNVQLGDFDWEAAHARANGEKISSTAHIYSSLHFNISKLVGDPIPHLLQALTIYPNDETLWKRVGEAALKSFDWSTALLAFQKCPRDWSAVNGTIIALYMSHLYEDCLQKLAEVLPLRPYYVVGRVLKEAICRSSPFWKDRCLKIFSRKWPLSKEQSLPCIDETSFAKVLSDIGVGKKLTVKQDPKTSFVFVDLSRCKSVADVGIALCDAYDRLEWFGDFMFDRLCFIESQCLEDFEPDVIPTVLSVVIDVVCAVEDLLEQVTSIKKIPKRKSQAVLDLEFSRRSARFHADFEISEEVDENLSVNSLLEKACVRENTIKSLFSLVPLRENSTEVTFSTASTLVETNDVIKSCKEALCAYPDEEVDIYGALKRYLFWLSHTYLKHRFDAVGYSVAVESYRRWRSLTLADNGSLACSQPISGSLLEEVRINVIFGECGLEEAILECFQYLSLELPFEMKARIYWLLALNGETFFVAKERRKFLHMLVGLMLQNSISSFDSLIQDYQKITVRRAQFLIEQIDCNASVKKISNLFETKRYEEVLSIIETNFDWREASRELALKTALIFIDSCIGTDEVDKAAMWIARLLDSTRGSEGTSDALERLQSLNLDSVSVENLSNIAHCIAPLLTEEAHYSDIELWITLYEAARRLEGEPSIEKLASRCSSDCVMPTSSLDLLVTAHDAVADTVGCYSNNYRFPLYALRELNRVRSSPVIRKIFGDSLYTDQLRAFQDEVHQCTCCLFGLPSRRKRQLEDHGGTHDYEPTEEDAYFILPLFLPDRLPSYVGSVSPDLIEIVQKKFMFLVAPTEEEKGKVKQLDEYIHDSELEIPWPRCSSTKSLRAELFYHLALNSYRSQRYSEALDFIKLFIVSLPSTENAKMPFNGWVMMAFAGTMVLFSANEDELLERLKNQIFVFRLAFSLEHEEDYQLLFNFGCALYQFRSRLRRYGSRLNSDDLRLHTVRRCMSGLLEESAELFLRSSLALEDGDPDKWECHYFLAKIYEKLGNSISQVMHHYYEAARQLEASGVQYPLRIKAKKQENVEAVELHYRAYACLVKWIVETEFPCWSREELLLMLCFAKCFQNHGVCRKEGSDSFSIGADVRFVVENCLFLTVQTGCNEVELCVGRAVECVSLCSEILSLCKEAFETCIQRFPHFKSYYRLAQLAIYEGNIKKASSLLFDGLLFKKKANVNCDNVFENLVTITKQELDRGDALQYHANRIGNMALYIASILRDSNALITLVHTFSTLCFCQNYDYVVKRDLNVLYACSLSMLAQCIVHKVSVKESDAKLLLDLFNLFQYAGRNKEIRLCRRILPLLKIVSEKLDGFLQGSDPVQYCKQLTAAAKQHRLGKRRAKKNGFEELPHLKEPRLSSDCSNTDNSVICF